MSSYRHDLSPIQHDLHPCSAHTHKPAIETRNTHTKSSLGVIRGVYECVCVSEGIWGGVNDVWPIYADLAPHHHVYHDLHCVEMYIAQWMFMSYFVLLSDIGVGIKERLRDWDDLISFARTRTKPVLSALPAGDPDLWHTWPRQEVPLQISHSSQSVKVSQTRLLVSSCAFIDYQEWISLHYSSYVQRAVWNNVGHIRHHDWRAHLRWCLACKCIIILSWFYSLQLSLMVY